MKNLKTLNRSIVLLLILLTISSCGIFRKTKKETFKHSETKTEQITQETKESYLDVSKSTENTTDKSIVNTENENSIEADEIIVFKGGIIKAKGNVKYNGKSKEEKQNDIYFSKFDSLSKEANKRHITIENRAEKSTVKETKTKSTANIPFIIGAIMVGLSLLYWGFKSIK